MTTSRQIGVVGVGLMGHGIASSCYVLAIRYVFLNTQVISQWMI